MFGRSTLAMLALAMAVIPSAVNAYDERVIGEWSLSGQDGVCSASFKDGESLIILLSADGDNEGGITLANFSWAQAETEDWFDMQLSLGEGWMDQQALSMSDLPGFWLPYSMTKAAPKWPDSFEFKLADGGTTIASLNLRGVQGAVAELNRCDAEVD
jgi:hypothetical protein